MAYVLTPWRHGPASVCPICSRCPVLAVADPGTPVREHRYVCLICEYDVDVETFARLVLIRQALD